MYTQNRETPPKTSLASWVPLINYYMQCIIIIIFKPKIFFLRALVLKLKLTR